MEIMERNIIFIGSFFPKELCKRVKEESRGLTEFSNHNFEMSIIQGLKNSGVKAEIISIPNVYSYPYHNSAFITHAEEYDDGNLHIKSVGFCNLAVMNKINLMLSAARTIAATLKRMKNEYNVEVWLNRPSYFIETALEIAYKIAKYRPKDLLIIPDIPAFVSCLSPQNKFKEIIKNRLNKKSIVLASKFRKHVFLTDAMKDFFNNKPSLDYMVMEGLIDVDRVPPYAKIREDKDVFLYTGTLREIFGVKNLVKAFEIAHLPNSELWICGSGDSADYIKQKSEENKAIKFFGLVDSDEALRLQHEATILVNPRTNSGEYVKYSFPSKTIEYLLSGRSVIAYQLPGIPDEYNEHLITPQDESVDSLAKTLEYTVSLNLQQRIKIGEKAREFIIKKKNSTTQVERILEFTETIII